MTQKDTKEWIDDIRIELQSDLGDITGDIYHDNPDIKNAILTALTKAQQSAVEEYKKELVEQIKNIKGIDDNGSVEFVKQIIIKQLTK